MDKSKLFRLIMSLFITIGATVIVLFSRGEFPQLHLWKSVDMQIFEGVISISLFFTIHILLGVFFLFIYFYQCMEIIKINNGVHEAKNQPTILLNYEYYAKIRHTMTTRFFFIIFGFFFMMSSVLGFIIIPIFTLAFFLIAIYEEKKILFPHFGNNYQLYTKQIRNRFFTNSMKLILIILSIFMTIGAYSYN